MKITFLGTGTSVGIPVIGCDCPVCRSPNPRNRRLRSSLYVQAGGLHLVIDTSLDFRQQALTWTVPRVDAVLITHTHADHIFGLDDVRRYNTMQGGVIPVYGSPKTIEHLERIFSYVHEEAPAGTYRPRLEFRPVTGRFAIGPVTVDPVPVVHGRAETYGYRIEEGGRTVGYVPDCSVMPADGIRRLGGVDVMILDALRHKPHSTHMALEESVGVLKEIGAGRSYLTHMCHDLDHEETQRGLPPGISLSHDGLTIEW